jgi:hypothetical protein
MKKIIRLTESDLARIVKRVLMEQEGDPMLGMKLAAVNFPETGIMGKRPEPNADVPKTLVGGILTPRNWIDAGEVRLTDGKKELTIYGKSTIPYSLSKGLQIGHISSAAQYCKGRYSEPNIPKDCTVFILMNNEDEYECNSTECTPR